MPLKLHPSLPPVSHSFSCCIASECPSPHFPFFSLQQTALQGWERGRGAMDTARAVRGGNAAGAPHLIFSHLITSRLCVWHGTCSTISSDGYTASFAESLFSKLLGYRSRALPLSFLSPFLFPLPYRFFETTRQRQSCLPSCCSSAYSCSREPYSRTRITGTYVLIAYMHRRPQLL